MSISHLDKEVHIATLANLLDNEYFSQYPELSPEDKRDIMVEIGQMYKRKAILHYLQNSPYRLVNKRR